MSLDIWIMGLTTLFFGILGGIIANFVWSHLRKRDKLYDMDTLSMSIVEKALIALPKKERDYYREEWIMAICDHEKASERLIHALSLFRAGIIIGTEARVYALATIVVITSESIKQNVSTFSSSVFQYFNHVRFVLITEYRLPNLKGFIGTIFLPIAALATTLAITIPSGEVLNIFDWIATLF